MAGKPSKAKEAEEPVGSAYWTPFENKLRIARSEGYQAGLDGRPQTANRFRGLEAQAWEFAWQEARSHSGQGLE